MFVKRTSVATSQKQVEEKIELAKHISPFKRYFDAAVQFEVYWTRLLSHSSA